MNKDTKKLLDDLFNEASKRKKNITFKEFLSEPIMTIKVGRTTTSIECSNCFKSEIKDHLPSVISHLLNMVNIDERAEITAKAIAMSVMKGNDKGSLEDED